jgi:hypothetical protein
MHLGKLVACASTYPSTCLAKQNNRYTLGELESFFAASIYKGIMDSLKLILNPKQVNKTKNIKAL